MVQDFDYWEQLPSFCGPRISPGLRVRRIVDEQNRQDECLRRIEIWGWTGAWRDAQDAAGGCPRPTDPEVCATAIVDLYIDQRRAAGHNTMRREDERWV